MARVGLFVVKCIWPSEHVGCEDDGAIELCSEEANYFVEGYSYCELHAKEFVMVTRRQLATEEVEEGYPWVSPDQMQDQIDNSGNGQWGFA